MPNMIARTRVTAHMGEWRDADNGRVFEKARTLSFDRGELVPEAWCAHIDDSLLAEIGSDLDALDEADAAGTVEDRFAKFVHVFDSLRTVDDVRAWLDSLPASERYDAATTALRLEREGKQRAGVYRVCDQVVNWSKAAPEDEGTAPKVSDGRIDGDNEPDLGY